MKKVLRYSSFIIAALVVSEAAIANTSTLVGTLDTKDPKQAACVEVVAPDFSIYSKPVIADGKIQMRVVEDETKNEIHFEVLSISSSQKQPDPTSSEKVKTFYAIVSDFTIDTVGYEFKKQPYVGWQRVLVKENITNDLYKVSSEIQLSKRAGSVGPKPEGNEILPFVRRTLVVNENQIQYSLKRLIKKESGMYTDIFHRQVSCTLNRIK